MTRISIEVSKEQHTKIKAMAVLQGKSIKELVLDRVLTSNNDENEAWEQLMQMLDKRIEEAESGAISTRTIEDIANDVLKRHGHNA